MENDKRVELREKMLKAARSGIKEAYTNEEYALMQAINAYNEMSRAYNLLYERLSEWYGLYFPEIKLTNPATLANLVIVFTSRNEISEEGIKKAIKDDGQVQSIIQKAKTSIGREMNADEKDAIKSYAKLSLETNAMLEELEKYLKIASKRILPNTAYLTDEKIAAELLSKAGSMERLAVMPASTIQLLGAEKALFKHIKFGSKPPKYGTLFKFPAVGNARKDTRGRIARAYAAKIAIALKADYFSKNFIAEKLKKDLEESISRIQKSPVKQKESRNFGRSRFNRFDGRKPNFKRDPKMHGSNKRHGHRQTRSP
ncbi:MAG: NOP58 family protein [Candidatus Marsarchaeota archaeon]|nr:NOP58 family protein [Candidatus Marsarchaeota archaeon]